MTQALLRFNMPPEKVAYIDEEEYQVLSEISPI